MSLRDPVRLGPALRSWWMRAGRWDLVALLVLGIASVVLSIVVWRAAAASITQSDTRILLALHRHASRPLDVLAISFTTLGLNGGTTLMTTAGVLLLLRAGRLDDAFELTVAPIACTAITSLLKVVFHTARPHLFPWILPARGFAYPSGHAATGACLYPLMAVMLWQSGRGTWRKGAAVGLVLVGIGMMWSRMYLGVHWPRDVVGGAAIGGAWCLVALRARRIPAG